MVAHNKKGRSKNPPGPPFIRLNKRLVDSQAWHDLSGLEVKAYIAFARKYNGWNNGDIAMGVRELALRVPCDQKTAQKAIVALENAGLIKYEKIGTFDRKHEASEFTLTDFDNETWKWATQDYRPGVRFTGADRNRHPKRCQKCGKSFKAQRSDAKFCSDKCRKAHQRVTDNRSTFGGNKRDKNKCHGKTRKNSHHLSGLVTLKQGKIPTLIDLPDGGGGKESPRGDGKTQERSKKTNLGFLHQTIQNSERKGE